METNWSLCLTSMDQTQKTITSAAKALNLLDVWQEGHKSQLDNVRRFLNIMHCAKSMEDLVIAISLDGLEASDRIEWHFIFTVLHRMNFDPNIPRMIHILYLNPTSRIQTNTDISPPLPLSLTFCIGK